ncbi:MAG: ABC transporter substrate-binding protein, partial [Candidatus Gallimonas sp.]
MKKALKAVVCVGLCCAMFSGVGCKGGGNLDTESRALLLAIGALDKNFNPFFSTSQNDAEIASMTQISMLTSDENGEPACGDDWPTVVQDYTVTMKDAAGSVTSSGDVNGTTEYQFLIKNGIKYSDGVDLTIKDVLFNLYVYLDPAYTGSSTIYSTDIQGLKAYRAQDPALNDDSDADYESGFYTDARARVLALINWSNNDESNYSEEDLNTVKKLFREEAESDWTTIETSWAETYKDTYSFNAAWEAYLYNEGLVRVQYRNNAATGGKDAVKDAGGKYVTTLQPNVQGSTEGEEGRISAQHFIEEINSATTDGKVSAYMNENHCDRDYALLQLQRECAIGLVYDNYTEQSQIANVLQYWATANNALEAFAAEARTEYYNGKKNNGQLAVETISGITTSKTTNFNGRSLDGEHDVLKIVINGVDPKAIWNFGFVVAPMHYYSDEAHAAAADGRTHFGVEMGDSNFFNDVLKAPDKNGLPVGAGAYKASSADGNNVSKSTFCSNNVVYFERNSYFETTGKNIQNAKIKYVNYKVMGDDKILSALQKGEIDYGTPNATPSNQNAVSSAEHLTSGYYKTGGYGYVGINPKFVPDVEVRQAIMRAMDTASIVRNYYGGNLAEVIYRPMSTTSWAYPKNVTAYPDAAYTADDKVITDLVEAAGWSRSTTEKNSAGKPVYMKGGKKLEITFTIAGETTDHPAYNMFQDTARRLNGLGFEITVKPDIQALKKLNSGDLAVWAAAWSSAIDPDMYQIYHKDSKATSVNNWNYKNI